MNFSGPWKATGPSAKVEGASEASFEFNKKAVTLKAEAAAKDVTKTGCSFVASVANYGKEFDLIKRDGDQVFFGAPLVKAK